MSKIPGSSVGPLSVLHGFADMGIESEALCNYGDVVRTGLDPRDDNGSTSVKCDMTSESDVGDCLSEYGEFDLGFLQPPCTKFSQMTSISGDVDDHDDLIPDAIKVASEWCDEWIVENKPKGFGVSSSPGVYRSSGRQVVTMNAKQFGLPIVYARSFLLSFDVDEDRIPCGSPLETEVSPYFSADRSAEWWSSVKGYTSGRYPKQSVAKNCVPSVMVHWLVRQYLRATNPLDACDARTSMDQPDDRPTHR